MGGGSQGEGPGLEVPHDMQDYVPGAQIKPKRSRQPLVVLGPDGTPDSERMEKIRAQGRERQRRKRERDRAKRDSTGEPVSSIFRSCFAASRDLVLISNRSWSSFGIERIHHLRRLSFSQRSFDGVDFLLDLSQTQSSSLRIIHSISIQISTTTTSFDPSLRCFAFASSILHGLAILPSLLPPSALRSFSLHLLRRPSPTPSPAASGISFSSSTHAFPILFYLPSEPTSVL